MSIWVQFFPRKMADLMIKYNNDCLIFLRSGKGEGTRKMHTE